MFVGYTYNTVLLPGLIVQLRQDFSLLVQILLKEEVYTMESLRDCFDLDGGYYVLKIKRPSPRGYVVVPAGGFIGNLGESKSLYSRLSALAKKAAKIWQSKLLESQAWLRVGLGLFRKACLVRFRLPST